MHAVSSFQTAQYGTLRLAPIGCSVAVHHRKAVQNGEIDVRMTMPRCLQGQGGIRERHVFVVGLCLACSFILSCLSLQADDKPTDLANQSLKDLMNTPVTSVSKTRQKLSQVASAVFVITGDDIARTGATNIPDLLRMVPGMDVAQITASTWVISPRGLNGRFANELFVMVNGRSVYTDETGGVFWDVLDLPLEDIDRIEVIRGPGGSVWGVNAANGVINIVTKKAQETHGGMIVAGTGNVDQGLGTRSYHCQGIEDPHQRQHCD